MAPGGAFGGVLLGQTVLLDLHGAVGSQNGKQTSGLEDWAWTSADFDVNATLSYVDEQLHLLVLRKPEA